MSRKNEREKTSRILDFTPTEERVIVNRILVHVHKAIDLQFPQAKPASFQFTKTVFSDDDEHTAIVKASIEKDKEERQEEDTDLVDPSSLKVSKDPTSQDELEIPSFWARLNFSNKLATVIIVVCIIILGAFLFLNR
jgi:hypothetical protein